MLAIVSFYQVQYSNKVFSYNRLTSDYVVNDVERAMAKNK